MMSQKYIYPSLFQEEEPQESVPGDKKEYDLTNLFERLAKSDFRSRFHLSKQDREYVMEKGLPTIRKHAEDFVAKRLAPAVIPNDGKQTPMRGHFTLNFLLNLTITPLGVVELLFLLCWCLHLHQIR